MASNLSEEVTKGLVESKLRSLGYPTNQDEEENGIMWQKENSYISGNGVDQFLKQCFSTASKQLTGNKGASDFIIKQTQKDNTIIVIECKADTAYHSSLENLEDLKNGIGNKTEISNYAINGALHYGTFLNKRYDVVCIGISGQTKDDLRITSFVLPKNKGLKDILLLENGGYNNCLMYLDDYIEVIDKKLNRYQENENMVKKEIKSYAKSCFNFCRLNGIAPIKRNGYIALIILGLLETRDINGELIELSKRILETESTDNLNESCNKVLEKAIIKIMEKDGISEIKKKAVLKTFNEIISSSMCKTKIVNEKDRYFLFGDNFLSATIYSINANIIEKARHYPQIDIMAIFYNEFIKYNREKVKEKGIVLTPQHITELFCDIAEFYLGKGLKLNEKTPVLDLCTGTGGFLIAALNRMDKNINDEKIDAAQKRIKKQKVRTDCLIGIENESSMFTLAYANMHFHHDGRSNMFPVSSINEDKEKIDIFDKNLGKRIYKPISDVIKDLNPKIGMINPPYSLPSPHSEMDFINSMLDDLKNENGIGIAIVPLSCASSKDTLTARNVLLTKHTLLACMSMPMGLFSDAKVGQGTCIMVFRAGVPHDFSDTVFLAKWTDDGFKQVPHVGRVDCNNLWKKRHKEWMDMLKGIAPKNDYVYLNKSINPGDDWCAETHININYKNIQKNDFITICKKYSIFLYMNSKGLHSEDLLKEWYLNNIDMQEFENEFANSFSNNTFDINFKNWKTFKISDRNGLFTPVNKIEKRNDFENCIYHATNYSANELPTNEIGENADDNIFYISRKALNNGIAYSLECDILDEDILNKYKNCVLDELIPYNIEKGNCITAGAEGCTFFYQENPFICGNKVTIIRHEKLNKYNAMFLLAILNFDISSKFVFGKALELGKIKEMEIILPEKDGQPDWKYMENFIKSLPYSCNI